MSEFYLQSLDQKRSTIREMDSMGFKKYGSADGEVLGEDKQPPPANEGESMTEFIERTGSNHGANQTTHGSNLQFCGEVECPGHQTR